LNYSKWDERFMGMAHHIAGWSKDDSSKVGAVIASGKRVVSLGFNGFPSGVNDEIISRDQKLLRTVHAEANALAFARGSVAGCSIYVTHPPCAHCTGHIIQHGIGRVLWVAPDPRFIERWGDSYLESMRMLREAGVDMLEVPR